jgi:hypothetical protein
MRRKLWKPKDVEFIFSSYNSYEERLLKFLKIIPYNEVNKDVWSPELVSLFLDIGGLIDSLARYILGDGKMGEERKIEILNRDGKKIEKEIRKLNIGDFERNLFDKLELKKHQVVLYIYSIYPDCLKTPYENYKERGEWWHVYNKLKHNRLDNYENASLYNTIKSLSALFLLIASYEVKELTDGLVRHEWMKTDWVPEEVYNQRIESPDLFWSDTVLFGAGHALKGKAFENIEKIPAYIGSKKLSNFIGKYNR